LGGGARAFSFRGVVSALAPPTNTQGFESKESEKMRPIAPEQSATKV
jgi:hypothetical protein